MILCCRSGAYNLYPDTPTGNNFVRAAIGTCSKWVTLNPSVGLTAMGTGTLWLHLNNGCSNQVYTSFEFDAGFSINGTKSAAGLKLVGHAHSGEFAREPATCDSCCMKGKATRFYLHLYYAARSELHNRLGSAHPLHTQASPAVRSTACTLERPSHI